MSLSKHQVEMQLCHIAKNLNDNPPMTSEEVNRFWQQLNLLQFKSQIAIDNVRFRASDDPTDENITIKNTGSLVVDLSGWKINAGSPDQCFTFPENTLLMPLQKITVTTAGDGDCSFHSARPIWNNEGDIATLLNKEGEIISTWAYGSSAHDDIVIGYINVLNEFGQKDAGEYIEISNTSTHQIDLANWRIDSMRNNATFTFPDHTALEPESSVRVFTNKENLAENEYSFHSQRQIWSDQSGGATLVDYLDHHVCVYHY